MRAHATPQDKSLREHIQTISAQVAALNKSQEVPTTLEAVVSSERAGVVRLVRADLDDTVFREKCITFLQREDQREARLTLLNWSKSALAQRMRRRLRPFFDAMRAIEVNQGETEVMPFALLSQEALVRIFPDLAR